MSITHDKWLMPVGPAALLVDKRASMLLVGALVFVGLTAVLALGVGSTFIGPEALFAALFRPEGDAAARMILLDIRLPRIVSALVAGYALGLAGAISQTLFSNRLATPDILGVNEGATLAIVAFVMLLSAGGWPFWIAPLGGLLAVAVLLRVSSAGAGSGAVLLVCGLCLAELLRSLVELLMSLGALHEVQGIYIWMQGSFIGQGYDTSLPVLAVLFATVPLQVYLARHLELLRLSPAMASSLGLNVKALRILGLGLVATLAALGASIGGPVAFIAMAAPVVVSSLVKNRTPALWSAGVLGAGLLLASDTLARTIAQPEELAAGVVTRILGGIFLLYLLIRDGVR